MVDQLYLNERAIKLGMGKRRILYFRHFNGNLDVRFAPHMIIARSGHLEVHGRRYQGNRKYSAIFQLRHMANVRISNETFLPPKNFDGLSADKRNGLICRVKTVGYGYDEFDDRPSIFDFFE
ncbi:MAG: hypothetical protein EOP06_29700 [Proteobacteria bacterium]|nr:MAG: hypothetical protein EOP06_29700 [Pseudomonadota bacterium]